MCRNSVLPSVEKNSSSTACLPTRSAHAPDGDSCSAQRFWSRVVGTASMLEARRSSPTRGERLRPWAPITLARMRVRGIPASTPRSISAERSRIPRDARPVVTPPRRLANVSPSYPISHAIPARSVASCSARVGCDWPGRAPASVIRTTRRTRRAIRGMAKDRVGPEARRAAGRRQALSNGHADGLKIDPSHPGTHASARVPASPMSANRTSATASASGYGDQAARSAPPARSTCA